MSSSSLIPCNEWFESIFLFWLLDVYYTTSIKQNFNYCERKNILPESQCAFIGRIEIPMTWYSHWDHFNIHAWKRTSHCTWVSLISLKPTILLINQPFGKFCMQLVSWQKCYLWSKHYSATTTAKSNLEIHIQILSNYWRVWNKGAQQLAYFSTFSLELLSHTRHRRLLGFRDHVLSEAFVSWPAMETETSTFQNSNSINLET